VGPSVDREIVRRKLPNARIEPPIVRGDLDRLCAEGARDFLVIDGAFAQQLAIAPSEIVAALRDGARVRGTASLGAIRAAECWPAGMEGLGAVHRLYRWRVISSDDEVAVAVDPERAFAAISVALIDVRYAVLAALSRGLLRRTDAGALLTAARRAHFSERRWRTIFAAAGVPFTGSVRQICERTDIKRRDAMAAVERLARDDPIDAGAPRPARTTPRTRGHDPYLGYPVATLRSELTRWLVASGRDRRYGAAADLWEELERTGALRAELMRWYAERRLREDPGGAALPTKLPSDSTGPVEARDQ
jgi:hypothetical protein